MILTVLQPGTDRGALLQASVVVVATLLTAYAVRRERSVVLLVVGIGLTLLGLMAMRTLH